MKARELRSSKADEEAPETDGLRIFHSNLIVGPVTLYGPAHSELLSSGHGDVSLPSWCHASVRGYCGRVAPLGISQHPLLLHSVFFDVLFLRKTGDNREWDPPDPQPRLKATLTRENSSAQFPFPPPEYLCTVNKACLKHSGKGCRENTLQRCAQSESASQPPGNNGGLAKGPLL